VGCDFGPVIPEQRDVFGSTVNTANRVTSQAKAAQILITDNMVANLGAEWRAAVRQIDLAPLKGKSGEVAMYEALWQSEDITSMLPTITWGDQKRKARGRMRIRYLGKEVTVDSVRPHATLGRSDENDLVVKGNLISRLHARIEMSRDRFLLIDQSTNGSFVVTRKGEEIFVAATACPSAARASSAWGESCSPAQLRRSPSSRKTRVKIRVEVEVGPTELREFLGLPDVASVQQEALDAVVKKLRSGAAGSSDAVAILRGMLPDGLLSTSATGSRFMPMCGARWLRRPAAPGRRPWPARCARRASWRRAWQQPCEWRPSSCRGTTNSLLLGGGTTGSLLLGDRLATLAGAGDVHDHILEQVAEGVAGVLHQGNGLLGVLHGVLTGLRQGRDLAVDEGLHRLGLGGHLDAVHAAVDQVVKRSDLLLDHLLEALVRQRVQLQAGVRDGVHGTLGLRYQAGSLQTGGAHAGNRAIGDHAGLGLEVVGDFSILFIMCLASVS
jgi:hypothetical protein